jgi:hypothetical protein
MSTSKLTLKDALRIAIFHLESYKDSLSSSFITEFESVHAVKEMNRILPILKRERQQLLKEKRDRKKQIADNLKLF